MNVRTTSDVMKLFGIGKVVALGVMRRVGCKKVGGQFVTLATEDELRAAHQARQEEILAQRQAIAAHARAAGKAGREAGETVYPEFNEQHITTVHPYIGMKCIVRCFCDGVHFGTIRALDPVTGEVRLTNSRRMWKWHSKFVLEELAMHGLESDNVKVGETIPDSISYEVIRVLPCTEAAIKSIESAPKANQ